MDEVVRQGEGSERDSRWDPAILAAKISDAQSSTPAYVADAKLPSVLAWDVILPSRWLRLLGWIVTGAMLLTPVNFALTSDPFPLVLGCLYFAIVIPCFTLAYVSTKRNAAIAYPVGSAPRFWVTEDQIIATTSAGFGVASLASVQRVKATERAVLVKFRTGAIAVLPRQIVDGYTLERMRAAAAANRMPRSS